MSSDADLLKQLEEQFSETFDLGLLAECAEFVDRAQHVLGMVVGYARGEGRSWEEIAFALGVDPETAQERYG